LLLKPFFILTVHDHAQAWKQEAVTKLGLFFPTHHTAQIFLPQISASFKPSKMPSVGKGLVVMIRLLKKWLWVQNSDVQEGLDALVSHWFSAVEVNGDYVEKWGA
jgi:hypothetical protein